jgi:hypothetical protein
VAEGSFNDSRKQLVYRGRTVTVYYEPDRRSIARCAVGPELTEAVVDLAEHRAKPFAVGISPRESGSYSKSFEVNVTHVAYGYPYLMTRVAVELANTDPGAGGIEWGQKRRRRGGESRTTAGHHVLGRTLAMLDGTRGGAEAAAEEAHRVATSAGDTQPSRRKPSVAPGTLEEFRDRRRRTREMQRERQQRGDR